MTTPDTIAVNVIDYEPCWCGRHHGAGWTWTDPNGTEYGNLTHNVIGAHPTDAQRAAILANASASLTRALGRPITAVQAP